MYVTEQNRTECSVALFSGMEQLFNISLNEKSSSLGLWSDTYMQLLSYITILSTLFSIQILMISVLTDKLYSNYATVLL